MRQAILIFSIVTLSAAGCGKSMGRHATEQLLESDAVDQAIAKISFKPLGGQTVFLDTSAISTIKRPGFVNSDYVIGSIRQQMVAAGCLLQDSKNEAEFIVEARVGALGTNQHEVVYGIPASSTLSTAASFVPTMPQIPAIPELALAKKDSQMAAAKVALFAYHRETKLPYWQSGVSVADSSSRDLWMLGAGPFQSGSIYEGPKFAGRKIRIPMLSNDRPSDPTVVSFEKEFYFGPVPSPKPEIERTGHAESAAAETAKPK